MNQLNELERKADTQRKELAQIRKDMYQFEKEKKVQ